MEESEKHVEGTRHKGQGTSQGSREKAQERTKNQGNHILQINSKSQIENKFQITIAKRTEDLSVYLY